MACNVRAVRCDTGFCKLQVCQLKTKTLLPSECVYQTHDYSVLTPHATTQSCIWWSRTRMTYQPRYVEQIWTKSPMQAVTVRLLTFYSAIYSLCQLDTVRIWNTAIYVTTWFRTSSPRQHIRSTRCCLCFLCSFVFHGHQHRAILFCIARLYASSQDRSRLS